MNYERILRQVRAHPKLWGDDHKAEQCGRIIEACKARLGYDRPDPAQWATWPKDGYMPAICPNVATD